MQKLLLRWRRVRLEQAETELNSRESPKRQVGNVCNTEERSLTAALTDTCAPVVSVAPASARAADRVPSRSAPSRSRC